MRKTPWILLTWVVLVAGVVGMLTYHPSRTAQPTLATASPTDVAIRLVLPAMPSTVAQRIIPPIQETPTLPPPSTGLHGLVFAPDGLDNCAEMDFYREQAGLPSRFNGNRSNGLGWRESNCRNTVHTFCCWGYWQLYFSMHMRDGQGSVVYAACEVGVISDYYGESSLAKQKQACVAKGLYDLHGLRDWVQ